MRVLPTQMSSAAVKEIGLFEERAIAVQTEPFSASKEPLAQRAKNGSCSERIRSRVSESTPAGQSPVVDATPAVANFLFGLLRI